MWGRSERRLKKSLALKDLLKRGGTFRWIWVNLSFSKFTLEYLKCAIFYNLRVDSDGYESLLFGEVVNTTQRLFRELFSQFILNEYEAPLQESALEEGYPNNPSDGSHSLHEFTINPMIYLGIFLKNRIIQPCFRGVLGQMWPRCNGSPVSKMSQC